MGRHEAQFPLGGLSRELGYAYQQPFTTPDASNVVPKESIQGRARGGSRSGLSRAFAEQLGSGAPIYLLHGVQELVPAGGSSYVDEFTTVGDIWTIAAWKSFANGQYTPGFVGIRGTAHPQGNGGILSTGSTLATFSPAVNGDKVQTITLTVVDAVSITANPIYTRTIEIFAWMDGTTPNVLTDGLHVRFVAGFASDAGGAYTSQILATWYKGGVATQTYESSITRTVFDYPSSELIGTYTLYLNPDSGAGGTDPREFHASWVQAGGGGADLLGTVPDTPVGQRIGFGFDHTSTPASSSDETKLDRFTYAYSVTGQASSTPRIIAVSNHTTYEEDNAGMMVDNVAGDSELASSGISRLIHVREFQGLLYTPGYFVHSGTTWVAGVDPKIYTPSTDAWTAWTASACSLPAGSATNGVCRLIEVWRNAILLAGDDKSPHVFYLSKQNAPLDWDYSSTAYTGAVAGTTAGIVAGLPWKPITAIVAADSDTALIACRESIFALRGHPRQGGILGLLAPDIGIVSGAAWCHGMDGTIYFLSLEGLYRYRGGVEPLSRNRVPLELRNTNTNTYEPILGYDPVSELIFIFLTPKVTTQSTVNWMYHIPTEGFWPFTLPVTMQPSTVYRYSSETTGLRATLLGCRDGRIRKFDEMATTDDGTTLTSYVDIGPLRLAEVKDFDGVLEDVITTLAASSADCTIAVRVGNSAEVAFNATALYTWTVTAGRNPTERPRVTGHTAFIRISATGRWALETLTFARSLFGPTRVN